jgi:hypothetical protein
VRSNGRRSGSTLALVGLVATIPASGQFLASASKSVEGCPGKRDGESDLAQGVLKSWPDEPDVSFPTAPEGEPAHSPEELEALLDRVGLLSVASPFARNHASASEQSKNEYRSSSVDLPIRDDHAGSCLLGPRGVRSAWRNAKQSIGQCERLRLSSS